MPGRRRRHFHTPLHAAAALEPTQQHPHFPPPAPTCLGCVHQQLRQGPRPPPIQLLVAVFVQDQAALVHTHAPQALAVALPGRAVELQRARLRALAGGGLAAGTALSLQAHAPGLRVRTVEPAGFDDMARSLASGRRERNSTATGSLCDAILTPGPGALTLPLLQRLAGPGLTVTDDQALQAMAAAFTHLRLVAEPGGAVALAAALFSPDLPETVICTISGGNVDPDLFARALAGA